MLLGGLERDRGQIDRVAAHVRSLERRTEEWMVRDHAELWTSLARRPRREMPASESAATASFEAGRARAAKSRPSKVGIAIDAVRRTDFYRDLPLRRALPVSVRKRLESFAARLASRMGRR
jgi:hypothetical protein